MAQVKNAFTAGMDKDSSKNKYDNAHYFDANNIRIITQNGLSSGAIENVKGNLIRIDSTGTHYIIGGCVLRDKVILWTTSSSNEGTPATFSIGSVWAIDIADLNALTGTNTITLDSTKYWNGGNQVYTGFMTMGVSYPVKGIGRYENNDVQKVYWVDAYNRLRHLNIIYNAETNDLENLSLDKLEVIGDIELTQPSFKAIVGGNLPAGKVQYVYQLYSLHGAETVFSPTSNLINLTNYSEEASTTEYYKGSNLEINTGKAIQCEIEIPTTGYNRVRIVAIHYALLQGEPSIRIVEEREISSSGETFIFTDTGTTLGTYILEDIRTLGTFLFIPYDLETKDNMLFPANIIEESWDVEFDARAYRFGGESATPTEANYNAETTRRQTSYLYQEDSSYFKVYAAGVTRAGATGSANEGDWERYNSSGVYDDSYTDYDATGYGTAFSIPEEADSINQFNDIDNDGNHDYRFMYHSDGETLGGIGANVNYEFGLKQILIDKNTDQRRIYVEVEGTIANPSFHDYSSPFQASNFMGYHRDEIYRFGVVFYDNRGRSSFVKWIADIRMPSISTLSNEITYAETDLASTYQQDTITMVSHETDESGWYRVSFGGEQHTVTVGTGETKETIAAALYNKIADDSSIATTVGLNGDHFDIVFNLEPGAYAISLIPGTVSGEMSQSNVTEYTPAGQEFYDFSTSYKDVNDGIYANILYLKFNLGGDLPSGVESYQIVRVLRGATDRTVVAQGMIGPMDDLDSYMYHTKLDLAAGWTADMYSFHSPEVAFNKNLTRQANDRLQEVGLFTDTPAAELGTSKNITAKPYVYKYQNLTALDNPQLPEPGSSPGDEHDNESKTDILEGFIMRQDQLEAGIGTFIYQTNNPVQHTDKGISFIFNADNSDWRVANTAYDARTLVNYRRGIFNTQYGGNTWSARRRNIYVAASEIVDEGTSVVTTYGGDTFIGMFDYLYNSWEDEYLCADCEDYEAPEPIPEVIYFPVETSINMGLRQDDSFFRVFNETGVQLIHDSAGIWSDGSCVSCHEYTQITDLYFYNTVYSKENDAKLFLSKPFDWSEQTIFDTRTYASNVKTNNELADSWLRYGVNSLIDVDAQYGPIRGLIKVNDMILFFQPTAFGVLSVNERALFESTSVSQLVLGTAGVLDRFDYSKTDMGASRREHITLTPNGLTWVDFLNKSMFNYTGGPEEISMMKGMDSWFRANIKNIDDMLMWYDPEWKEVYLSDNEDTWTLMYNELMKSYTAFYGVTARVAVNYFDQVLTTNDRTVMRRANDFASYRGWLDSVFVDSDITILINPSETDTSIYNNFNWYTEVTLDSDGSDAPYETIKEITLWNDYQHSGVVTLTVPTNVRRRSRKWRTQIPRALYKPDGVTTLKQNDRVTAQRDARFRDSHLFAKFSWDNTIVSKRFILHDIVTSITQANI